MNVKQHLVDRHIDFSIHSVSTCDKLCTAVFYLYNLSGQIVGYQQYRPFAEKKIQNKQPDLSRYFTYAKSHVAVWGLETWNLSNTLFVTEGIFDAARLTELGYSAVAAISNNPSKSVKRWFSIVRSQRRVVAICDPDAAGMKLASIAHSAHYMETTDLGDASAEQVQDIISKYA